MNRVCVAALLAMVACGDNDDEVPFDETLACTRPVGYVFPPPVPRADLLIVLDRTASATRLDEVNALFARDFDGWGLDLHVAVITSELGAAVPGCDATRTAPVVPDPSRCGIDGPFLDTARLTGSFSDALGCLLDVPTTTCPVSQPLAAALAALDDPRLAEFRRYDRAYLGVVIVTDSDDCSLLGPAALHLSPGVGDEAAVDFACFAQGNVCDPPDATASGPHTNCRHRTGGGLIDPVATQQFLTGLGGDAPAGLAVIAGGDHVVVDGGHLAPACGAGELDAGPAPRLRSIANADSEYWLYSCEPGWNALGRTTLDWFKVPALLPCLDASVDREPEVPGVQAECSVVSIDGDGAEHALLPACDDPERDPALACWYFDPSFQGCNEGYTPFRFHGGDHVSSARLATVECVVDCDALP